MREVGLATGVGGPGGRIGAGVPGVEVGVEVEDGDGLGVGFREGAEGGEGDRVVAAEGDEFGVDVGWGVGEGKWTPGQELSVGGGHLVEGQGVVEGGDGDVAAVEDKGPGCVGVDAGAMVEGAVGCLAGGGVADSARAEAGSCSIAHCCVERGTDDANVKWLIRGGQAFDVSEVGEGADACECPLRASLATTSCSRKTETYF